MVSSQTRRSTAGDGGGGIQVIARAALVLRALDGEPGGLSLSQLAQRVELPRSTVHRIVMSLASEGFAAPVSPNGRFRLGPELLRLAETNRQDRWQDLRPHMQKLFDALDETVDCAILDGTQLRFVLQIPARHGLRAVSDVGARFPLHCTANGKALLAELDDHDVIAMFPARLERLTPQTLSSRDELLAELREVRETGVAYDREEHTLGISAAGIALRVHGVPTALSVPMPTPRFTGRESEIARVLQRVRGEVAATLARA